MTLRTLCLRAHICRYEQYLWLRDCDLTANVLSVPARDVGEAIGRLYGARLREVCSDITIRVQAVKPQAPEKPRAMKAAWYQDDPKQGDML